MNRQFNYIDFIEFLVFPFYLRISKQKGAASFLYWELKRIEPYSKYIPLYRSVRCKELEFFYLCFKSVCAMDEKLFEDLISHSWRGVVWASWVSCITPYPEKYMTEQLKKVKQEFYLPYNDWLVDIALNILDGKNAKEDIYKHMETFRNYTSMIPRINVPLRVWYSEEYLKKREEIEKELKFIYKNKGTADAIEFIKKNKDSTYDVDYNTWVRSLSKKE